MDEQQVFANREDGVVDRGHDLYAAVISWGHSHLLVELQPNHTGVAVESGPTPA